MKKYKVVATLQVEYEITVEAESVTEANEKAWYTDLSKWVKNTDNEGVLEIAYIEEIV